MFLGAGCTKHVIYKAFKSNLSPSMNENKVDKDLCYIFQKFALICCIQNVVVLKTR